MQAKSENIVIVGAGGAIGGALVRALRSVARSTNCLCVLTRWSIIL